MQNIIIIHLCIISFCCVSSVRIVVVSPSKMLLYALVRFFNDVCNLYLVLYSDEKFKNDLGFRFASGFFAHTESVSLPPLKVARYILILM